jgi:5-bromo-4-chloroindolyl phosphate hydrolysis protein
MIVIYIILAVIGVMIITMLGILVSITIYNVVLPDYKIKAPMKLTTYYCIKKSGGFDIIRSVNKPKLGYKYIYIATSQKEADEYIKTLF